MGKATEPKVGVWVEERGHTGGRGEGGVEEGDGGVDEEGIAGNGGADGGVCDLEEGEAGGHGRQFAAPPRADLEPHRHRPQHQRRREERARVGAGAMGRHGVRRRGEQRAAPHCSHASLFHDRSARTLDSRLISGSGCPNGRAC